MALEKFRGIVRGLIAEGVAPTPTEFAKRGLGYVDIPRSRRSATNRKAPTAVPGSQVTFIGGKYTAARREELLAAGWVKGTNGYWQPPQQA